MSKENKNVRIAVVQASPVIMDLEKTVEKALGLIKEAGRKGANIVVFPEAFNLHIQEVFHLDLLLEVEQWKVEKIGKDTMIILYQFLVLQQIY
ncbi:nitrilase-related carbon-nitrogen hydrolase [Clostridioides difficile]|uniref:nitrilase-related carbon-nitrogen hydrolase n=1 Tax=Clostridioides difficile TaxID=1496 RepID=UPI0004022A9D|nr:nitrilase-related carbon-nitrogen hydrolase [Clostridioides difficile]